MDVVVAALGELRADPRSLNIVDSLAQKDLPVNTLEMQTLMPRACTVMRLRSSSHLVSEQGPHGAQYRTWSSRSMSRVAWIEDLLTEVELKDIATSLSNHSDFSGADEYWLNQFSLAHAGVSAYLRSVHFPAAVIVAEDLATAVAALLVRPTTGWSVVYDAHELFTESLKLSAERHSTVMLSFFHKLETFVWAHVETLVTVSPGLARYIDTAVGHQRRVVLPNFVPRASAVPRKGEETDYPINYVYTGGAAPFRQVDCVVRNWPKNPGDHLLNLYLSPSLFADEIIALSALNPNIRVHKPVQPEDLVRTAAEYDVGIMPYRYPYPYSEASPNKFGEYVAANLPVLCQQDSWVAKIVADRGIGIAGDFEDEPSLLYLLSRVTPEAVSGWRARIEESFRRDLNWDVHVSELIEVIETDLMKNLTRTSGPNDGRYPRLGWLKTALVVFELLAERCRPILLRLYSRMIVLRISSLIPRRILRRIA